MAVKCCTVGEFCSYNYLGALTWKWGRLAKTHTYVLIFSRNQTIHYNAFKKASSEVKVLAEIDDCYNAVHAGQSKNRVVVFEKLDGKSSKK